MNTPTLLEDLEESATLAKWNGDLELQQRLRDHARRLREEMEDAEQARHGWGGWSDVARAWFRVVLTRINGGPATEGIPK